jgi:cysteine desulfurase
MLPLLANPRFSLNPHSRTHQYGWEAEAEVERAREAIATLIGAVPQEIIFTSGATESNNMVVKRVVAFSGRSGRFREAGPDGERKLPHIITSAVEHKCILDSCRAVAASGAATVTYLPVAKDGTVTAADVEAAMTEETVLVSLMAVNNETGVRTPLRDVGTLCRERGVYFHTDAAQAVGKLPIDVNGDMIDLMSISGHKLHGPKGVGVLYKRRRPRVRMDALISGGGQERGMRSGTLPAHLCAGMGEAARIAGEEMARDSAHVAALSARLLNGIRDRIPEIAVNGTVAEGQHYPGILNVSFAFVEGESLLMALKDVALSSGSACTSASLEPSYVLRALGVAEDMSHSSLRFGISRFTTVQEIDYTLDLVVRAVERLRAMSPLYELHLEGVDISTIEWNAH